MHHFPNLLDHEIFFFQSSGINNALIDIWNFRNSGILIHSTQVWCERISRASENTDPLISQCGQITVRSGKARQLKESIPGIPSRRLKAEQALTASPLVYTGSKRNKHQAASAPCSPWKRSTSHTPISEAELQRTTAHHGQMDKDPTERAEPLVSTCPRNVMSGPRELVALSSSP